MNQCQELMAGAKMATEYACTRYIKFWIINPLKGLPTPVILVERLQRLDSRWIIQIPAEGQDLRAEAQHIW